MTNRRSIAKTLPASIMLILYLALSACQPASMCNTRASSVSPAPGATHALRTLPGANAHPDRASRRASLLYFGHMTDLHVTDEMSPFRLELLDATAVGNYLSNAAWRPQEALSAQTLDAAVQAMNARARSNLAQGSGARAAMAFALVTGDLIDNLQHNELELALGVLRGGRVDPFSGKPIAAGNDCLGASSAAIDVLNARVASRSYSGVQRYALYPADTPLDRYVTFYDPAQAPPASPKPHFPRYVLPGFPGLLERAQQRFDARGLAVPFFVARGNHDSLAQGNFPPYLLQALYGLDEHHAGVTGCRKLFPNRTLKPYAAPFDKGTMTPARNEAIVAEMQKIYQLADEPGERAFRLVPPDPGRRFLTSPAFPEAFMDVADGAGYGFVSKEQRAASHGYAHYYAWRPEPGLRFFSLDTNPAGPGPNGSLSQAQFQWLARELAATPQETLVVVFGHHALETLDNDRNASCPPKMPDCHGQRPPWGTSHLGCPGSAAAMNCCASYDPSGAPTNLRDLLLTYSNVILYVSGHTHMNRITPYVTGNGTGFWQVTTASIVEWPQQSRTLELMDNGDGSLSIFSTLVPLPEDVALPQPNRHASSYDQAEVVRVARTLAAGDVEWREAVGEDAAGRIRDGVNIDGNVELLLTDPRQPGRTGSMQQR